MTKKSTTKIPQIKTFRLADLRPDENNPRTITAEALAGLTKSIERFGLVEPIVVNVRPKQPKVIGGHQRLRALQALGIETAACVTVRCGPADERLLNVTLNNPKVQGEFAAGALQYIEQIRADAATGADVVNLKIEALHEDLAKQFAATEPATPLQRQELELRPFLRTHILLSFDPALFRQLAPLLERIIKIDGVEYEQGSN